MILAQTLRSAGLEQDGYTTFSQKDREEVAKAIYVLRVSVKVRLSNNHTSLWQSEGSLEFREISGFRHLADIQTSR